jgi:hypothetical protein
MVAGIPWKLNTPAGYFISVGRLSRNDLHERRQFDTRFLWHGLIGYYEVEFVRDLPEDGQGFVAGGWLDISKYTYLDVFS